MQNKKLIKTILTLFVMILMLSFSVGVYAEEPADHNDYSNEVVPGYEKTERWSYTRSTSCALTISSSGYATATVGVEGYQDLATKIIVYTYLQKYENGIWTNVSSFSNTSNTWHADIEQGFGTYATWGHDHRVYNSIYVYSGDAYEHISTYSYVHHYHSTSDSSNCTL